MAVAAPLPHDGTNSPAMATLLLFLSQSLHVSNPVVLLCYQRTTVDLATAILSHLMHLAHVHSKWMVINNCGSATALLALSRLTEIPFIISVVDSNGRETAALLTAMHDACPTIAQTTHLLILDDPLASVRRSEALFTAFAAKFVVLHILSWHHPPGMRLVTKRTWFAHESFLAPASVALNGVVIHDDEHRRWSRDMAASIAYRQLNYALVWVPPFAIKTSGGGRAAVTSVAGIEVDTVALVAARMQVAPHFVAAHIANEECSDECVMRDDYYERVYVQRDVQSSSVMRVAQMVETSEDKGLQDFM